MSSEDVEARADAVKFADGHVPMALEKRDPESPLQPENPEVPGLPAPCCTSEACVLNVHMKRWECETHGFSDGTKPKRRRRTPAEVEADKLVKAQEKERRAAERAAERERVKAERAAERAKAKLDAKREQIAEAEGGLVELPAAVFRNGNVVSVSHADAWKLVSMYLDDLDTDVENSGYPVGHELYELRTVQLGGEEAAVVFDATDPAQMEICSLALTMAKRLWSHSASVEAVAFVLAGLIGWDAVWAKLYDNVLKAKLNDPKMSGSDADALKELAHDILREYAVSPNAEKAKNDLFKAMGCTSKSTPLTPPDKNGWYMVNKQSVVMCRYAGSDVLDLAAVRRVLPPPPVHDYVIEREREFEAACATVALIGFELDYEHTAKKLAEERAACEETQKAVAILSDGKITNPKSPDVLKALPEVIPGLVLPIHRKTKKPTADKGALEGLALQYADDPVAFYLFKQILAYRHHDTTCGLLLEPLKLLCEHGDGRMRPTVYTIEASTGRCSCRRPNGQQFSRQGGVRACVKAGSMYLVLTSDGQWLAVTEGGELIEMRGISADFEGCEIRVAAALSGDKALYEAETSPFCWKCQRISVPGDECSCGYKKDDDGNYTSKLAAHQGLHWRTAHSGFGTDATKEHRYQAKRGTFTKLFGGSFEVAAAQVYCAPEDMKKLFDAFDADSPDYANWNREMRELYKAGSMVWKDYTTGQQHSAPIDGSNRMIYWTYSGRPVYITNGQHAATNGTIQGTARELLVDGTLKWRTTKWGRLPLLPVHDELDVMVPAHEAEEAVRELCRCMTTDILSSPGFPVLIGADTAIPWDSWPDSS